MGQYWDPNYHTHTHTHRWQAQARTQTKGNLQTLHFQRYRCVLLLFALWLRKYKKKRNRLAECSSVVCDSPTTTTTTITNRIKTCNAIWNFPQVFFGQAIAKHASRPPGGWQHCERFVQASAFPFCVLFFFFLTRMSKSRSSNKQKRKESSRARQGGQNEFNAVTRRRDACVGGDVQAATAAG